MSVCIGDINQLQNLSYTRQNPGIIFALIAQLTWGKTSENSTERAPHPLRGKPASALRCRSVRSRNVHLCFPEALWTTLLTHGCTKEYKHLPKLNISGDAQGLGRRNISTSHLGSGVVARRPTHTHSYTNTPIPVTPRPHLMWPKCLRLN